MTGDAWLAEFIRAYGTERAARELARLTEVLHLRTDDGLTPLTDADMDAMTFAPGELDLLLTPFDAGELIGIDEADGTPSKSRS
jgi:hypothetical protein